MIPGLRLSEEELSQMDEEEKTMSMEETAFPSPA